MYNFTPDMKKHFSYNKLLLAVCLVFVAHLSYGAFIGKTDDQKNKFSLKNLNSINRAYSLSSLRTNSFLYKGSQDIYRQNNGNQVQVQSLIRMERGNTTYVYPYKYTVKVPRFKTPTAPSVP